MGKHTIIVTDTDDELLAKLVESGRYGDVSEAVRAGLRLLEEDTARAALRDRLMDGYNEAKSGELAEGTGADVIRAAFAEARQRRA